MPVVRRTRAVAGIRKSDASECLKKARARQRLVLAAIKKHSSVAAACRAAGVHRQRHYEWLVRDLVYRQAFDAAFQASAQAATRAARRNGAAILEAMSDGKLCWMLKRLLPEKYYDGPYREPAAPPIAHEPTATRKEPAAPPLAVEPSTAASRVVARVTVGSSPQAYRSVI